jgi:hypothetical protein
MANSLKSRNTKKRPPKYAYVVPENGILYTVLGDPIILDGPSRYVCGGCLLLLKHLDARSWLRSPLLETPPTLPMQTIPYATSGCGCEVHFLVRNPSLFQNFPVGAESTFMAFYLTCCCISGIRARIDALLPMGPRERLVLSRSFWGEGFVDARKSDGSPASAHYLTKYILKDSGKQGVMFNAMRLLRISHGFPRSSLYAENLPRCCGIAMLTRPRSGYGRTI